MLGEISPSFKGLDEEQRQQLAKLLAARKNYLEQTTQLLELQLAALANPTAEAEEKAQDFSSIFVGPARREFVELAGETLQMAVDMDGLKEFLPALLMGLLQKVNLTLLFPALNIDPDMAQQLGGKITGYVKGDGE